MHALRGNAIAFVTFVAAFAAHIVGGATDQRWLFAVAVALIFASTVLFPVLARLASGDMAAREARVGRRVAITAGIALTSSALWAANGRALAWWQPGVAALLVAGGMVATSRLKPQRSERSQLEQPRG